MSHTGTPDPFRLGGLVACLRFMRKHSISAIQMFLMWRHAPQGSTLPELKNIPDSVVAKCPRAPAPNALFSDGEIEALVRLTHDLNGPLRLGGWALANRCVWERLAPDHFPAKAAAQILREAHDTEHLASWVGRVMQKDHPHYELVFNQVAIDVVRATHPYYVEDDEFRAFVDGLKNAPAKTIQTKRMSLK